MVPVVDTPLHPLFDPNILQEAARQRDEEFSCQLAVESLEALRLLVSMTQRQAAALESLVTVCTRLLDTR